ncbi:hypothetical protein [Burkholderia pseudomultivorans]|uniref:hypothetical protein n=1 Tax=Burkholderia pseudomultivorans TaxID=1207504 RepID=UPI000AF62A62|nr:hypothetical protein [Burkholderia pseudomultivorans]
MRRPGLVTAFACVNLMGAFSSIWAFDARVHIGVDPVYPGSVFPARWQWNWLTVAIGLTFVTTVGLFRGANWARWMALVLCVTGYVVAAPVGEARMLPSYGFMLAGSVLVYASLFFCPTVTRYFTRSADVRRMFSIRGTISMALLALAMFTAHSIIMGVFHRTLSVEIAWIGTGVFVLPMLLLILVTRWRLEVSLREIAAFLLAVAATFAYQLCGFFLAVRFVYPADAMAYFGWRHSLLLTALFGICGLALTAYLMRRSRAATTMS